MAKRVLAASVSWLQDQNIEHFLEWHGFPQDTPFRFSKWSKVADVTAKYRIRALGHTLGEPLGVDGAAAVKLLKALLLEREFEETKVVLMVRDMDHQPERREGLEQARAFAEKNGVAVLLATPDPKREAWVLAGFEPQDEGERGLLAELRRELSFCPCEEPQRLRGRASSGDLTRERDIKVVLGRLTQDSWEREAACWCDVPLQTLERRGATTGLANYLTEIRNRLIPRL